MRRGRAGPQGAGSGCGCGGAFAARREAAAGGAPPGGAGERPAGGGGGGLGVSGRHGGAGPGDGLHDPRAAGARQVGGGGPGPCPTGALGSGARGPARPGLSPPPLPRVVHPAPGLLSVLCLPRDGCELRLVRSVSCLSVVCCCPKESSLLAASILPPFILIFFFLLLSLNFFHSLQFCHLKGLIIPGAILVAFCRWQTGGEGEKVVAVLKAWSLGSLLREVMS